MSDRGNELLGLEEARAEYFPGVTLSTVRYWIKTGEAPPSARIGRYRYFRRGDVEAWIDAKFSDQRPA